MGSNAYDAYKADIQESLECHNSSVSARQTALCASQAKLTDAPEMPELQARVCEKRRALSDTQDQVASLVTLSDSVDKEWSSEENRIIGSVEWAPSISLSVPPHQYTLDLSVLKLQKDRFKHLEGNMIRLGKFEQLGACLGLNSCGVLF